MTDPADAKAAARRAAMDRRRAAFAAAGPGSADILAAVLRDHRGRPISGFLPIRTEIDPTPAMAAAAAHGPVGVPVIDGPGLPLRFARWHPGCTLVPGPFGAQVPQTPDWLVPEILIVPLLAFSAAGGRLGYGGGFYDRTLERLRAANPATRAIGFAFAAQQDDALPLDGTDQPLDMIVTEQGVILP